MYLYFDLGGFDITIRESTVVFVMNDPRFYVLYNLEVHETVLEV